MGTQTIAGEHRSKCASKEQAAGSPIAWLISCQDGDSAPPVHRWWRHANRSSSGQIFRMNNCRATSETANQSDPRAELSTLGQTISTANDEIEVACTELVFFMHGLARTGTSWGILHGPSGSSAIDLTAMNHRQDWDGHVLPIGWSFRNSNQNYQQFVANIRSWSTLRCLHLYGCRLGASLFGNAKGLLDMAEDLQIEVIGYSGWTVTTDSELKIVNTHSTEASPAPGARVHGNSFRDVELRTANGLLPGWQVRAHYSDSRSTIDIVESDEFGSRVRTYDRARLNQHLNDPINTSPLSTTDLTGP